MDIPKEFELSLKKIKIFAQKDSKVYFVYLPEFRRFNAFYYNEKQFNQIKNLVLNQGIIFIDTVDSVFAKENRALIYFPLKNMDIILGGI